MSSYNSFFKKNSLRIFSSSAISQIITLIFLSFNSKLYGPFEFGIYSSFIIIINFLTIFSAAKYELAIISSINETDLLTLLSLSKFINRLFFVFLFLCLFLIPDKFLLNIFKADIYDKYILILIPISSFLLGSFQIANYYSARVKKTLQFSINKVIRSLLFGFFAILFFFIKKNHLSLLFAFVLSHLISNIYISKKLYENLYFSKLHFDYDFKNLKKIILKYRQFPCYALPSELINYFSAQMPVFLFTLYFDARDVAYFILIYNYLSLPIVLISGSILDIYKENSAQELNLTNTSKVSFANNFKILLTISLPLYLLIYVFGNYFLINIVGDEWKESLNYLNILLIMFFVKFISSPLSFIYYIYGKQKENLLLQIYIFLSTLLICYIGFIIRDKNITLKIYSFNFTLFYVLYLFRSYQIANTVKYDKI